MKVLLRTTVILALLVTSCGQPDSVGIQSPASATPAQELPTSTAILLPTVLSSVIPTTGTEIPALWQPPAPTLDSLVRNTPLPTLQTPRDVLIRHQAVGVAESSLLIITKDGSAYVYQYDRLVAQAKLTNAQMTQVKALFVDADFAHLQARYILQDPPGVIGESLIVTTTYTPEDGMYTVETRGTSESPPKLVALEHHLRTLLIEVGKTGTTQPDIIITYFLDADTQQYRMDIDSTGRIYFEHGREPTAQLPRTQLDALITRLLHGGFMEMDDWYTADVRDLDHEHRAILELTWDGRYKWVNALTGATIPQELHELLVEFATIYTEFEP